MKDKQLHLSYALLFFVALWCQAGLADNPLDAEVHVIGNTIRVIAPSSVAIQSMNVYIGGPGGTALETRTMGDSVEWTPSINEDGTYYYEVEIVVSETGKEERGIDNKAAGPESMSRVFGSFHVFEGAIVLPQETIRLNWKEDFWDAPREAHRALGHWVIDRAKGVTLAFLNVLLPAVHAADLTASNVFPSVFFDTSDLSTAPAEWQFGCDAPPPANIPRCFLYDRTSENFDTGNSIINIQSSGNSQNALSILADGDVQLSDGTVRIDQGFGLGIGTTASISEELTVSSTNPEIGLRDATDGQVMNIQYDNNELEIEGAPSEQGIVRIHESASPNSFVIAGSGNIAMGATDPAATLHVRRSSGPVTLRIETEGNAASGAQVGIILVNGGPEKSDQYVWDARVGDVGDLVFNYNEGVSGFKLAKNGNFFPTGSVFAASSRELKEDFQHVDVSEVLEDVLSLEITNWKYRRDLAKERHIGPVAEDFQAVFGLGDGKYISYTDGQGIVLAAIQGLDQKLVEKEKEITALKQEKDDELSAMEKELIRLRELVNQLIANNGVVEARL